MNTRIVLIISVGVTLITLSCVALVSWRYYINYKMDEGRCELKLETQKELMTMVCETAFEETLISMDKKFCATWNAEVELKKLENSGVITPNSSPGKSGR